MRIVGTAFVVSLLVGCGSAPAMPAAPSAPALPSTTEPAPPPAPTGTATPTPPATPDKPASTDPLDVAANAYSKVFENESVRVLTVKIKPGDKVPMHAHPDHVAYVLTSGKLKVSGAQGAPQEMELKAGQAVYLPAQSHSGENTGTTELKAVIVELKGNAYPAAVAGGDPLKVGPKIYKQILDNDRARVMEVTFAKGAKIDAHAHPDHLVYVLTPGKLKVTAGKAPGQDFDLKEGQAMYLPAQAHSAQNTGTTELKLVVFELKPKK